MLLIRHRYVGFAGRLTWARVVPGTRFSSPWKFRLNDGAGAASNKGSERESQEERAVVPGEHCSVSAGKVVDQTGLLGGEE